MKIDKLKVGKKYRVKLIDHEMPDESWTFEEILIAKTKDTLWFLNLEDVDNVEPNRIKKFIGINPDKCSDFKFLKQIDIELSSYIEEVRIDDNGELSNDMGDSIKIKKL